MTNNRILVTGSNGQLGRELRALAAAWPAYEFIFLAKEDLPIHEFGKTRAYFEKIRPMACINCAAYTAVDKAESDREQAFLVNAASVAALAEACSAFNARFIHISTDYVFDGLSSTPLKEDDNTGPVNVYGASKLEGEKSAFRLHPETVVLRTSWVYSEFGNNFVKTMMRLMREKPSIGVINDQVGSPTYAADLASAIMQILDADKFVPGIYNYSNEGEISWYDFAVAIKELTASNCEVRPIPASSYLTPARRPNYSLLDKTKVKDTYGLTIPAWRDSLFICIKRLLNA